MATLAISVDESSATIHCRHTPFVSSRANGCPRPANQSCPGYWRAPGTSSRRLLIPALPCPAWAPGGAISRTQQRGMAGTGGRGTHEPQVWLIGITGIAELDEYMVRGHHVGYSAGPLHHTDTIPAHIIVKLNVDRTRLIDTIEVKMSQRQPPIILLEDGECWTRRRFLNAQTKGDTLREYSCLRRADLPAQSPRHRDKRVPKISPA